MPKDDRPNLHIKIDDDMIRALDEAADRLSEQTGLRATRSDIVRLAVAAYLETAQKARK